MRECVDLTRLRYHLSPASVSFAESVNGERPQVRADADELRAAISNLLDNAVKYSTKDVQISVEVATLDDKKVAVRIADRGVGIPSAQLKRIFKRFYRVPGKGTAPGPDGTAVRLLLRVGEGQPKELHRVPTGLNPPFTGFVAALLGVWGVLAVVWLVWTNREEIFENYRETFGEGQRRRSR